MSPGRQSTPTADAWQPAPGTLTALALTLALVCACDETAAPDTEATAATAGPLTVCAVNYPLAYFAERIGGPDVSVAFPAPGDVDPAYWQPSPAVVAQFQDADLVLLNGAGYARWIATAPLPRSRQVDTGAAFADRTLPITDAATHTHGTGGDHSHGEVAFTTWLDLDLAALQARAVGAALRRALPDRAKDLDRREQALLADLATLDRTLLSLVRERSESRGVMPPMLASHPVYQYLQRRYELDLRSVHWEPDSAPEAAQWAALQALLDERPARWMLWEGNPLPEVRAELLRRGVDVLVVPPCGNRPASGDLLDVLRRNVEALASALQD